MLIIIKSLTGKLAKQFFVRRGKLKTSFYGGAIALVITALIGANANAGTLRQGGVG